MRLGVCYYPEHWPEDNWADDARQMVEMGISVVRVGEFSWSRLEPAPDRFEFDWLRRALDVLGEAGLDVCLGTPTATPPKWLVDQNPDMLAVDEQGQPRRFGSRRHYCFSSSSYAAQARRITQKVAAEFGQHPAVKYWQTDNEYGCHNTVRSYSAAAEAAFREWLQGRYHSIDALNKAWGTVFWSQEYSSFGEVDLPNLTVTEPNPSHVLDFYRFSSDQVVRFNQDQVDIIRGLSPGREITHNYMGFYAEFDHFKVGEALDFASWDSYPLGFLDQGWDATAIKARYMRQGHPDFAGFHHDLYRAVGKGRLWVMEQQPGPVNWAPHNPAPLPGMVRAWSLEAFGHGAEVVSYFRWRQAPFAQEQLHAGLKRVDGADAPAAAEARQVVQDIAGHQPGTANAKAALVFSYDAFWMFEVQPQGATWNYWQLVMDWYGALCKLGVAVDVVPPGKGLDGYDLVLVPSLPHVSDGALAAFKASRAQIVFGPRSGSKTQHMTVPQGLAPGPLHSLLDFRVTHSESFADHYKMDATFNGAEVSAAKWLDHVDGAAPVVSSSCGQGLLYRQDRFSYVTAVPNSAFLEAIIRQALADHNMLLGPLPEGLRCRQTADSLMVVNYAPDPVDLPTTLQASTGLTSLGSAGAFLSTKSQT